MPTPFMHLQIAERVVADCQLGSAAKSLIEGKRPAYYLGNVAPDFQRLCGIPRSATHFYDLPPRPDEWAYPKMLAEFPELARASKLPSAQAVFVAAYSAHLMFDLLWHRKILMPYFVLPSSWSSRRQRFIAHSVLLTYLDGLAVDSLPQTAAKTLAAAEPNHWLPFAKDTDLTRWRDMLVEQLGPGASPQTAAIYAGRLAMSPEEFEAFVQDRVWMDEQLFREVPVEAVNELLDSAAVATRDLVSQYLLET